MRLGATDLIPLASWARTAGTCRYCSQRFGGWHPAAEALTTAQALAAKELAVRRAAKP